MCGGSKTQQQTTTQAPVLGGLVQQQANNAASVAANTNPASLVAPVAGFTAPQTQGFDVVGQQANAGLSGLATPYLGQAATALQGAGPVTAQSIQAGLNPFIDAQVAALQSDLAHQNAITGQQVNSNAAQLGALTGDRSQIANINATDANNRNAALATAGLESGAYGQAANIAQGNQNAALNLGAQYGNLGTTAQNTGVTNANQLLGIGNQQQGQQQAVNNYGAQVAGAPLSLQQWIDSQTASLAPGAGSTSTTTTPGPNPLAQYGGLAVAALGLLAKGGRVKGYDSGGGVAPLDVWDGLMTKPTPAAAMPSLAAASGPQAPQQQPWMPTSQQLTGAQKGIGDLWSSMNTTTGPASINGAGETIPGFSTTVSPTMAGMPNYLDNTMSSIGSAFGFRKGGGVRGYDDGGGVLGAGGGYGVGPGFSDEAIMAPLDEIPSDAAVSSWNARGDAGVAPSDQPIVATEGEEVPTSGTSAQASSPSGLGGFSLSSHPATGGLFGNPLGLSEAERMALLTAGGGAMAAKTPFLGSAIGEGILAGAKGYEQQQNISALENYRKATIANQGARLANQADAIANRLKLGTDLNATRAGQLDLNRQKVAQGFGQGQTIQIMKMLQAEDPSLSNEMALDKAKRGPQNNDVAWERVIAREADSSGRPIAQVRTEVRKLYGLPDPTIAAPLTPPQLTFPLQGRADGGSVHLDKAREAIARGADPAAVRQRLNDMGLDAKALDDPMMRSNLNEQNTADEIQHNRIRAPLPEYWEERPSPSFEPQE